MPPAGLQTARLHPSTPSRALITRRAPFHISSSSSLPTLLPSAAAAAAARLAAAAAARRSSSLAAAAASVGTMAAATSSQQQHHEQQEQPSPPQHHIHHHRVLSTPSLLTAAAGAAAARRERQQHPSPPPAPPPPEPHHHPLPPIYLVVLNHHLPAVTAQLWPAAVLRIAADGGANRIHDELPPLARRVARERRRWQREQQQQRAAGDAADAPNPTPTTAADDDDDEADHHPDDERDFHPLAFVPDALVGDLDSVRPEVRALYASKGARVTDLSHDQDSTDLDKCLMHVESHLLAWAGREKEQGAGQGASSPVPLPPHHVVVVGALGGRLDHTLSNLGALHRFPHLSVTIWSDGNTVRLVRGGGAGEGGGEASAAAAAAAAAGAAPPQAATTTTTRVVSDRRVEGPACGVVPLAGEARVTSRGLRWDMDAMRLSFGVGGLLSTSNVLGGGGGEEGRGEGEGQQQRHDHEAVVELAADSDVLWMAEARDFVPPHVWDEAERRAAEVVAAAAKVAARANGNGSNGNGGA